MIVPVFIKPVIKNILTKKTAKIFIRLCSPDLKFNGLLGFNSINMLILLLIKFFENAESVVYCFPFPSCIHYLCN